MFKYYISTFGGGTRIWPEMLILCMKLGKPAYIILARSLIVVSVLVLNLILVFILDLDLVLILILVLVLDLVIVHDLVIVLDILLFLLFFNMDCPRLHSCQQILTKS